MSKWMSLIGGAEENKTEADRAEDGVKDKYEVRQGQTGLDEVRQGQMRSDEVRQSQTRSDEAPGQGQTGAGGTGEPVWAEQRRGAREVELRDEGVDVPKLMEAYEAHGGPFLKYLQESYSRPEPTYSPEEKEKMRLAGAIGDSLKLLGEMYGHGIGASVNRRKAGDVSQGVERAIGKADDAYTGQLKAYQEKMREAMQNDFKMYFEGEKEKRAYKRKLEEAAYNAKLRGEEAERTGERQRALKEWEWKNVTLPKMKEAERAQMARDASLHRQRMAEIGARQSAGSGGTGRGGRGSGGYLNIRLDANDRIEGSVVNPVTGERSINIPVTEAERDMYKKLAWSQIQKEKNKGYSRGVHTPGGILELFPEAVGFATRYDANGNEVLPKEVDDMLVQMGAEWSARQRYLDGKYGAAKEAMKHRRESEESLRSDVADEYMNLFRVPEARMGEVYPAFDGTGRGESVEEGNKGIWDGIWE